MVLHFFVCKLIKVQGSFFLYKYEGAIQLEMKTIKKSLLQARIRVTKHAREKMDKRGYTESDIMSCIWSGEITKTQFLNNDVRFIVEGSDLDKFPMVIIVGRDYKDNKRLVIVSVFPPIKSKFGRVI